MGWWSSCAWLNITGTVIVSPVCYSYAAVCYVFHTCQSNRIRRGSRCILFAGGFAGWNWYWHYFLQPVCRHRRGRRNCTWAKILPYFAHFLWERKLAKLFFMGQVIGKIKVNYRCICISWYYRRNVKKHVLYKSKYYNFDLLL